MISVLVLSACESQGKPPAVAPVAPPVAPPPPRPKVTDITAQDYEMPKLPHGRVTLTDAFGGKHPVDVEIAATRDARTRGLMWRTQLPEGTGMLFIFEKDDWLSFWMKNTLIPLDMIFIRSDLTIVGIVERAEPKTLSARQPNNQQSMYVLEVPGGWSEKIGLKPGLKVQIDGTKDISPVP
ncbi:MAG: DUF192 domain-containing protein [Archangium sp.]|nr:DUF192 domain-containing protein [Archangium sp.]